MLHRLTGRFIGPKIENEKKPRKMISKSKKKGGGGLPKLRLSLMLRLTMMTKWLLRLLNHRLC